MSPVSEGRPTCRRPASTSCVDVLRRRPASILRLMPSVGGVNPVITCASIETLFFLPGSSPPSISHITMGRGSKGACNHACHGHSTALWSRLCSVRSLPYVTGPQGPWWAKCCSMPPRPTRRLGSTPVRYKPPLPPWSPPSSPISGDASVQRQCRPLPTFCRG